MPGTYAVLDTESTIFQKGHPFSARNKLCLVGIRIGTNAHIFNIEYGDEPYGTSLAHINRLLSGVDLVVGFNLKHDLNWLARYGIRLPDHVRVFDCQLAEFILSHQSTPFPSLDGCCAKYGLAGKSDVVARDYWNIGIDTPQVPMEILGPYLENDLEITDDLYCTYRRLLDSPEHSERRKLLALHNQDLRVLQEMEFNGMLIAWDAMAEKAKETEEELNDINRKIREWVPENIRDLFNTGSNDHVSLLLYGGLFSGSRGIPYNHEYKSGVKAGTTAIRYKWEDVKFLFPRLVEPHEGTELAKDGYWSTGADTLKELDKPKELIGLLLRESELSKLLTTYYHGFPATAEKMDWQDGLLHGQFNQCVVISGRLSSSRPNQQNLAPQMQEFIMSRYV